VARLLVVGGASCRALALTRDLVAEGHAVRAVTRTEEHRERIEEAGGEVWIGTPDVIGTLRYALENVTLVMWLLGRADQPELHGSRLEMMLEKTIDTTARGVIYEAGPAEGVATVERMAGFNEIPFRILRADPDDQAAWLADARGAIDELLAR
jgi:nucleoside-diphosphate-sugar epimerase